MIHLCLRIFQNNLIHIQLNSMTTTWLSRLALLLLILQVANSQSCSPQNKQFLVTMHPHLDAFWLNTDDELRNINFVPAGFLYAMNQRNSKTILNSMLNSLNQSPSRKYMVSEVVFFKDWYDYLPQGSKENVKKLILNGQIEIPNGGWVQNDEAVCYFDDILDQYTIGLDFLYRQFGVQTKIGWATDSFGHSHSQVALQHLLGFEFQGIERIDDRYIYERKGGPLLQFYWSPISDSNGRKYGGVVTQIRHFLHEVNDLRRENEQSISFDFRKLEENMLKLYGKNKLFRFLGNDFQQFIPEEFQNLESAFKSLNKNNDNCLPYKYGNPQDYLVLAKEYYDKKPVPVRQYDFMPNYDQDHYWSGYYTTNPDLKKICKDFSRLVNLYRKVYTRFLISGGSGSAHYQELLRQSDELLAVIQHHDGITATSKYHIQNLFKERMNQKTIDLLRVIAELKGLPLDSCNLYQGGNRCNLNSQLDKTYVSVVHEGVPKIERLEFVLPQGIFYEVEGIDNQTVFCNAKINKCYLVIESQLLAGQNVFILNKIEREAFTKNIFEMNLATGDIFKQAGGAFSVALSANQITYNFKNGQFKISLVKSNNSPSSTQTTTWNKYGDRIDKNQNRMSGIYIMANNGAISNVNEARFSELYAAQTAHFTKLYIVSAACQIQITIQNNQPHLMQLIATFKPASRDMADYFLKIDSGLDSKGQFFHDSNGYLVINRKVGVRPDYQWTYKPEDKINANTYPICSFAYALAAGKKMILFTDRAAGFTQYDTSFLLNIDRLTGDDYKGVGEGYSYQVTNTFRYKLGLVADTDFIEREWQRSYDEPLVAYYSDKPRTSLAFNAFPVVSQVQKFLKYTVFSLSKNQFVLRLINLGQNTNISLKKFSKQGWSLPELGLDIKFVDVKQSFASGVPFNERKSWVSIPREINIFNSGANDSLNELLLAPLQIRSFRINLKQTIVINGKPLSIESNPTIEQEHLETIVAKEATKTNKKPIGKRCF